MESFRHCFSDYKVRVILALFLFVRLGSVWDQEKFYL